MPSTPAMAKSSSEGGLHYFTNSKVGSATGFMVVAGNVMALPHRHRSASATSLKQPFTATSEYANQFKEVPHCYASMRKKPLVPYSPNAPRSQLAQEEVRVPLKNGSSIVFNDPFMVHKRRFVTTHKNDFTSKPADLRSNGAMLAEAARQEHKKQFL